MVGIRFGEKNVLLVVGLAALAVAAWTAFASSGTWEDDAYIFFQYAKNLAAGQGMAFNSGEVSFGVTSVLWTLILGFLSWVFHLGPVVMAKLASIVLFSASVTILTRLVIDCTQNSLLGFWTGLLVAVYPHLVLHAVSGMEIPLNLFLLTVLTVSFFRYGEKHFWLYGILIGLAFLTRPENALWLPLFVWLAATSRGQFGLRIAALLGTCVGVVLPWELYLYSHTSLFLPPTRDGKLLLFLPVQYGVTLDQFRHLSLAARLDLAGRASVNVAKAIFLNKGGVLFLPFLLVAGYFVARGKIALGRFGLALAGYGFGLVALFVLFFPLVKQRYFVHLYPFLIFISVLTGCRLWQELRGRFKILIRPLWAKVGLVTVLLIAPLAGFFAARKFASMSREQSIRAEVGRWLKTNTPPDARVALEPIGAVAYFADRYVVDLGGLINPDIWPFMSRGPDSPPDALFDILVRKRVTHVVDYSQHPWAGKVVDLYPERFLLAAQISSPYPPAGYNQYDIYKLNK